TSVRPARNPPAADSIAPQATNRPVGFQHAPAAGFPHSFLFACFRFNSPEPCGVRPPEGAEQAGAAMIPALLAAMEEQLALLRAAGVERCGPVKTIGTDPNQLAAARILCPPWMHRREARRSAARR